MLSHWFFWLTKSYPPWIWGHKSSMDHDILQNWDTVLSSQNFLNVIINLDSCDAWSCLFMSIHYYYAILYNRRIRKSNWNFIKPIMYAKSDWLTLPNNSQCHCMYLPVTSFKLEDCEFSDVLDLSSGLYKEEFITVTFLFTWSNYH